MRLRGAEMTAMPPLARRQDSVKPAAAGVLAFTVDGLRTGRGHAILRPMFDRGSRVFLVLAVAVAPLLAQTKPAAAVSPPVPSILGVPLRTFGGLPLDAFFTRDGSLLLTSCAGACAQVWDAKNGRRVAAFAGKGEARHAYFCGPKQDRVAVAFAEDGVRLFLARTGKEVGSCAGAANLCVSPDGTVLAATKGEDLVVLDAVALKPTATIRVGGELLGGRFSDDGKQVVVSAKPDGRNPFARVEKSVDLAQKKVVGEKKTELGLGKSVPFGDGKSAMRSKATQVEQVALPGGEVVGTCKVPLFVVSLVVLRDGAEIVVGDNDGRMVHVEFATGKVLHDWREHRNTVSDLVASPDGKTLVSMSWDQTIRFWNLADGTELFASPLHNSAVTAVAFAADGKSLASGAHDNSAIRWTLDGKPIVRHAAHEYSVIGVAPTAAGLWSASHDGSMRLTDDKGGEVARVKLEGKHAYATALCSTDGDTLISGHRDGTVQWRDGKTGAEQRRGDAHTNDVNVVACDASGGVVVSGGKDGKLVFWDPATAAARHEVAAHEDGVAGLCIGPDGSAFSCGRSGVLVQWNVATGEPVRNVVVGEDDPPHLHAVAVWTGPGLVVTAGRNRLYCRKLVDLTPASEIELPAGVTSLAVSRDGLQLAAGLEDGTVALFGGPVAARTKPSTAKPRK